MAGFPIFHIIELIKQERKGEREREGEEKDHLSKVNYETHVFLLLLNKWLNTSTERKTAA